MKTGTYILTIGERPERRRAAEAQVESIGIRDAITYIALKEENAAWSNFQSHRNIVTDAVKRDFARVMICEDDVVFREPFHTPFQQSVDDLPPDWEMLLLGCRLNEPPEAFSPNLYRVNNHTMMHAYVLSRAGMKTFLDHAARLDKIGHCHSWDAWLGAQPMNRYLTRPILAIQADGFSDIQQRAGKYLGEPF